MRGRDGGRGDAGRDIGVWSVAINGNLSCDKVLGQQTRAARGRRAGAHPFAQRWTCADLDRAARARGLDGPATVFPPGALKGWKAGGQSPPPADARVVRRAEGPGEGEG